MIQNLKKLRGEKGISQKQLANAIGVTQQSVNKYENQGVEPDIDTLIQIADYFDTSVDYLIGHSEVRRKIEVVHDYDLNADESCLIEGFRRLTQKQQSCVRVLLESYSE